MNLVNLVNIQAYVYRANRTLIFVNFVKLETLITVFNVLEPK